MALNGFRSAEDRASRLVHVQGVFVTVTRTAPQRYDVYKDGEKIGEVFKVRARWDWAGDGVHRIWRDMSASRRSALEELLAAAKLDAAIAKATGGAA